MRDVEAVTERLKAAEEAHGMKMEEQQRRSNDLQERLVEIRALKEEVRVISVRWHLSTWN